MYRCISAVGLVAVFLIISFLAPGTAMAQLCGGASPDMLIILDKSGSMTTSTKWNPAKTAINNLVAQNPSIRFGLMLFSSGCTPPVSVKCAPNTHSQIMTVLNSNSPSGGTQAGGALKQARNYLVTINPGKPKYVLLITDGCSSTSCGHPTNETAALMAAGIKTFVVGFSSGISGVCPTQLNPMAEKGGTALPGTTKYYVANSPSSLNAALKKIAGAISCCGNGKLDSGEICDTAIKPPTPGACPTICNDGNKCTKDAVTGTQCKKKCLYTPITQAKNGDGCCPPGATSLTDSDCTKICGNGLLEAGEKCDPGIKSGKGKCPTAADCDDNNVCTSDALSGSGCTLKCVNTPLTASTAKKDGCCPAGASSKTDADCAKACGNGILESGETCDPGITSGTGKCPTIKDCDDKNVCTKDALSGGACTLKCSNTTVAADPTKKDGCCPAGANSKTDADCKSSCGNGVLEANEKCDTGIKSGPGKCKTLKDCDDNDPCTIDTIIGAGCSSECKNTPRQPDATKKDGCCPKGHSSKTDADCLPPCGPDKTENCVNPCKDVTCPTGQYCKNGKCVPFGDGGSSATGDGGSSTDNDGTTVPTGDGSITGPHNEAGIDGGEGVGFDGNTGCACQTSGNMGALPVLLLMGLIMALARRRRR